MMGHEKYFIKCLNTNQKEIVNGRDGNRHTNRKQVITSNSQSVESEVFVIKHDE